MISAFYTFILYPIILLAFWILSFANPKIREGFKLRKNKAWLKPAFNSEGLPTYWFHVASGELEYAKPVIRELKKNRCKIVVTYFSPSVLSSLKNTPEIDIFIPSPWDTPWNWKSFIKKYNPKVLAISRTDLWPQMIWSAYKNKVPSILFSATLPSHSGRVASFWGRLFYSFVLEKLTYVSCVNEEDAQNFKRILLDIKVSSDGDTRFDQVFYRLENTPKPSKFEALEKWKNESKVFIAGSTWPEDEEVLLPAFKNLITKGIKILIAPHEVDSKHLDKIKAQLDSLGIAFSTYSALLDTPAILIDQVGVLAPLYSLAEVAFVGGSFKKSVHSVMEPAAAGCYTLVGPFHYNSREALLLKSKGFIKEINWGDEIEKAFEDSRPNKNEIISFMKSQKGVSIRVSKQINELSPKPQ